MLQNLLNKFRKRKQQLVRQQYSSVRWIPSSDVVESVTDAAQTVIENLPEPAKPKVHVEPPPSHTKPLDYHTTHAEKPEPPSHHDSHHHDSHHHDSHHDSGHHDSGGYDSGGFDSGGCDGGGGDGGGGGD